MNNPDVRKPQLFLDDHLIEQTVRIQRVVHQPHKYHDNPVYSVGALWEGRGMVYLGGVYVDPADGIWKAWYVTLNPPLYPEIQFAVCMITSNDGFHWTRPELDVYKGHDGEKTNIVLDLGRVMRAAAPTILYEPENVDEPWTMVISLAKDDLEYKAYILRSPDGINWRWERETPNGVVHGMHDRCTAFMGPDPEFPYVLLSRGKEDMSRWGLVRSVHRTAINPGKAEGKPTRVLVPDLEDEPSDQIYHAHAFPYGDAYIGLFQWYHETEDPHGGMELMVSRDSVRWQRVRPRRTFLPPSPGGGALGAFDCQVTDTALSPPVRTNQGGIDTLWFFYWGGPAMHGNRHLTFGRAMGLAQLRADGFCSLRAHRFPGTLFTKPFEWPGGRLLINAAVLGGGGGWMGTGGLRTEVLYDDLEPVEGLGYNEADIVAGDGTGLVQTWKGDPRAIDSVEGKMVRFKFYMDNVDLYSFRAAEN
jgi:hypothetical protein